jgi:hypothetical protein
MLRISFLAIWDRCYDFFKKFSQKKWAKKLAFLTQTKGNFAGKVIVTLVFEKNASFFR